MQVSKINGIPVVNTFVTGFTYDGVNTHTIGNNDGTTLTAVMSNMTLTNLRATNVYGDIFSGNSTTALFYGDGSNLTNLPSSTDNYVSGGTYNGGTLFFSGNSVSTTFNVDVNGLLDDTNSYLTGGTYNSGTKQINFVNKDDTLDFDVDLSEVDTFVTGATNNTGTLTFNDNRGGSFNLLIDTLNDLNVEGKLIVTGTTTLTGIVDLRGGVQNTTGDLNFNDNVIVSSGNLTVNGNTYTTGTTYSPIFSGNSVEAVYYGDGSNLTGIVHTTDTYVTGGTYNSGTLFFSGNSSETTFNVDVNGLLDDTNFYVTGGTLNGNSVEIDRTDTANIFRISGGTNVTISEPVSGTFKIDSPDTGGGGGSSNIDRKLFIPAAMASAMGSSSLTYHSTTGVALLSYGGGTPDNDQGSFPMLVPQDYISGGTFELVYTTQTTANNLVWSFAVTNCSYDEDFSTITESGAHMDLVVSGKTFLNRGTTPTTTPTGTTFNVNDAVTVRVNRDASDSRDTATNITSYIYGLVFNYTANN
jgi:hypothetical protein